MFLNGSKIAVAWISITAALSQNISDSQIHLLMQNILFSGTGKKYVISCILWELWLPESTIYLTLINLPAKCRKLSKTHFLTQSSLFYKASFKNNI